MNEKQTTLENMHRLFLEALRHREQEIFRYLAIIGPALGGFIWLIHESTKSNGTISSSTFVVGTLGVLLLLFLGAVYSLALGYNYRYITFQLAKLEKNLKIDQDILKGWPKTPDGFLEKNKILCKYPWCMPPEVIRVFWWAFLVGIAGVTASAHLVKPDVLPLATAILVGGTCLAVGGLILPRHYGEKLHALYKKEKQNGNPQGPLEEKEQ